MRDQRRLPIGVQSFVSLRKGGFVYVDKTRYIYELANGSKQYFLSRPRRFGKSLFLSTLKAYWEGRKELFEGLAIEKLEQENEEAWQAYPVFCFDFNGQNYQGETALDEVLDKMLERWEVEYGCEKDGSLSYRFQNLLIAARDKTGRECVVLVDEYDKPLLEALENNLLEEHNKAVFKGFFSNLKSYDEYLRFVFITGVTKFSKVSIFSDLNQLDDISLSKRFAGLCGMTEKEVEKNFTPEIEKMAGNLCLDRAECLKNLRKMYDGYHFHPGGQGVYNPFSLLKALAEEELESYWFATGTPTFLVRRLKNMHFDVRQLAKGTIEVTESMIMDYRADNTNPIPLLYQTGYLTIMGYDRNAHLYSLGFPNEEVKYGFLTSLFPEYVPDSIPGSGKDIISLRRRILDGDTDGMRDIFTALFASIPYTTDDAPFEHYFQSVLYIVFTLLGQYAECEVHSSRGRADCVLTTDAYVYIFEFKVDKSAKEALTQIEAKGYAEPFAADERKIFKIGVSFDSEKRSLVDWEIE